MTMLIEPTVEEDSKRRRPRLSHFTESRRSTSTLKPSPTAYHSCCAALSTKTRRISSFTYREVPVQQGEKHRSDQINDLYVVVQTIIHV